MDEKLKIEERLEKTDFSMKLLYLKSINLKETSEIYQQVIKELAKEYMLFQYFLTKYYQSNDKKCYYLKYSNLDNIEDALIRAGYLEPKVKTKTK